MSKFYVEDPEQIYGCFRCGEIMGEVRESDLGIGFVCESCGEKAVVTFTNTLDILNDLYLKGDIAFNGDDMLEDEFDFEI